MTAADDAWKAIFETYGVLRTIKTDGHFDITANELRQFREPRLLTKFDHEANLPAVFRENGLSLLTLSSKDFRVGPFKSYSALPEWKTPGLELSNRPLPDFIQSIDADRITGEPGAINAASLSGMVSDFLETDGFLTVSGRMRTGKFGFKIADNHGGLHSVDVAGAQIEIDAAFETRESLAIFEVKNHISTDFLVRQIYYPYRVWASRLGKPVRTVFMTFANDVFDFHELVFDDFEEYSSVRLLRTRRYALGIVPPKEESVRAVARRARVSPVAPVSGVPFPQADRFERVLDLISILDSNPMTVEDLAGVYSFDVRQSDYYYNAARFLGLATSEQDGEGRERRRLTGLGTEIESLDYEHKMLRVAELVLGVPVVAEAYLQWSESGAKPTVDWVAARLAKTSYGAELAPSTVHRRSQTLLSWTQWLRDVTA